MSSTLAPHTVASSASNAPSPSSASPPVIMSASSSQSQQPSSASPASTVAAITAPTSQSSPASSSTVPSTSTSISSTSSAPLSTTAVTSSSVSQSTTSTSVLPTSTSTSIAPTTTQVSTSTSSSLATSQLTTTTSSIPTSTAPSASNSPSTFTSSSSLSDPSSSPASNSIPLTTVLEGTTIFITSTNSQGQVLTSAPAVVTEVITTTGNGGMATTITQAVVNPTLAPNNSTTGVSSFFANTGAVVGVFVVVGLAAASIMMWILFAIRRRLRMKGIEEDNAFEAAVTAAGLNRTPLDDDDDDDGPMSPNTYHQFSSEMGQRSRLLGSGGSGSLPTSAPFSEVLDDPASDSVDSRPDHRSRSHPMGYVPARTTSPSPRPEQGTDDPGSSRDRKSSYGHTPTYSAGSFEPLLANYVQNASDRDPSALTMELPPRRSSQRLGAGLAHNSSGGSPEGGPRTSPQRQNSSDSSVPQNEEDETRQALTVRNVPDNQSQHSL